MKGAKMRYYSDDEDRQIDQVLTLLDNLDVCCYRCSHFNGGVTCEAFPDQIPSSILTGQVRHEKRLFNQKNNLVFRIVEVFLLITVLLFGCSTVPVHTGGQYISKEKHEEKKVVKIYEKNSIIPKFIVKDNKVYTPDQIVVPKYIIRKGKIYEAGKIVPIGEIK